MDPEAARHVLSTDRAQFVQRGDIMELIPVETRLRIKYPTADGHIDGFRELFVHLATNPPEVVDELRQLIIGYYRSSHALRGHLSQLSPAAIIWKGVILIT